MAELAQRAVLKAEDRLQSAADASQASVRLVSAAWPLSWFTQSALSAQQPVLWHLSGTAHACSGMCEAVLYLPTGSSKPSSHSSDSG